MARGPIMLDEQAITADPVMLDEIDITAYQPTAAIDPIEITAGDPAIDPIEITADPAANAPASPNEYYPEEILPGMRSTRVRKVGEGDPLAGPLDDASYSRLVLEQEQKRREARRDELRALLKDYKAEGATGPGAREQAFTTERGRPWGRGLAALSKEGAAAWNQGNQSYHRDLAAAREADTAERESRRPVDAATLAMIAEYTDVPISSLRGLTMGSPLIKLMGQGGLTVQSKMRGQDFTLRSGEAKNDTSTQNTLINAEAGMHNAETAAAARVAAAKKGGGGGGGDGRADARAALLVDNATKLGIPLSDAQASMLIADPTTAIDGLPAEKLGYLQREARFYNGMDEKTLQDAFKTVTKRDVKAATDLDTNLQRKMQDPTLHIKLGREIISMGQDIQAARQALAGLSPAARNAIAKFQGEGTLSNMVKKAMMSESDQVAKAQLDRVLNSILKIRSGMAVTDSEWRRMAGESGYAADDFDLFNSTAALEQFVNAIGSKWATDKRYIEQKLPNIFKANNAR